MILLSILICISFFISSCGNDTPDNGAKSKYNENLTPAGETSVDPEAEKSESQYMGYKFPHINYNGYDCGRTDRRRFERCNI